MPVPAVQRFLYRKLRANIEVERPQVNRALDRFGAALRKIGLPYATGLTRKKATLFASLDPNMRIGQLTVSETKEALRKMDRTRANLALGEYWRMEHGLPKASRKRVKLDRNILLAIAVSLGLHVNVTEIVCITLGEENRATAGSEKPIEPNAEDFTEEAKMLAQKRIMAEAELKLTELRQQKIEFIQWLLQDLIKGRTIPISDFAVKAVVLDRNIARLENLLKKPSTEINEEINSLIAKYAQYLSKISQRSDYKWAKGDNVRMYGLYGLQIEIEESGKLLGLIDEQEMRSRYEIARDKAGEWEKALRTTEEKIDGLHYFDNFEILKGYLAGTDFLDVLIKGIYNCAGATWLNASLEDDLVHSPDYGVVLFSEHIRSWFRDAAGTLWEIENTNGGPPRRTPFTIGVRSPIEGIIADYLIRNGIPVDQLPEELAEIFSREFPASGLSLPKGVVPNPYYGVRDPSSIAGTTQELYEKMAETAGIIEEARAYAGIYSLLQIYGAQGGAGSIDLSLIDLSRLSIEAVCQIAENSVTLTKVIPYWYHQDIGTGYSGAILLADLLSNANDHVFSPCRKEGEWAIFEETAKRILNGGNDYNANDINNLNRGMVFPGRAREWLQRLYESKLAEDGNVSRSARQLLARIASPEDFDFFKEILFNAEIPPYIKQDAMDYFGRMRDHEAIRARDILLRAYQTESDYLLKKWSIFNLARLGYGMEVLTYLEEKLPSDAREYFNQYPTEESLMSRIGSEKDYFISRGITTLFPDRDPTPAELQNLIRMIHKEEDTALRAKLILILALNGNVQEAQEELSNYLLTIGYGNSDRGVANFFRSYNDLLRHADLLINEGFYPEPIIEALRSILNEPGNDWGMRAHAAIKLILAGEL